MVDKSFVEGLFLDISPCYDKMNEIISLGQHKWWRRKAIKDADFRKGGRILDVGCGTGDFCIELEKAGFAVFGIDPVNKMLKIARSKISGIRCQVSGVKRQLLMANGHSLPFLPNFFDGITIGFSLRHLDISIFLDEARRVLKSGGRVVILEVSSPNHPLLRFLHKLYLQRVVPSLAYIFCNKTNEYAYLHQSFELYMPSPKELKTIFLEKGFVEMKAIPIFFGACSIFIATKD
jgi:demethylmenaquinone methyltransferase/2-methoxy-6-polyprenyl-1,4-benzoquinol methylase